MLPSILIRRLDSIQSRILAIAMLPVLVLALLLGGYMIFQRQNDLEENLKQRGHLLARQIAAAADYGIFSGNVAALQNLLAAASSESSINQVLISNAQGVILASSGQPLQMEEAINAALLDGRSFQEKKETSEWIFFAPVRSPAISIDDIEEISLSISQKDRPSPKITGLVMVSMTTLGISQEKRNFTITVALMMALILAASGLIARRMSQRVSQPIIDVAKAVEQIGQGAQGVRVEPSRIGVLNLLGNGVNKMATQLELSLHDLESRINEATSQLLEKKQEAERANMAKTKFLAAASHDLRQPMHALGMFVAALTQVRSENERQRLIEQIGSAVGAMGDLLDALLDISRLDAGGIDAQITVFPLQTVFDHLRHSFGEAAGIKGLDYLVRRTSFWVRTDRILLERILSNLISNAIRYTPSGRVLVAARLRKGRVLIQVRDSGIGIPSESHDGIFQEFFQLGNPERDRSKGIGLGLAIVKRLTDLLGHPLFLRSSPSKGSTFSLELPRAAPQAPTAPAQLLASPEIAGSLDLCILVIDDDPMVRDSLESLLKGWGCQIALEPGDGSLPLRLLRDTPQKPDIILCDYRLANGLNGIELVQSICKATGSSIPAVIITGDTDEETANKAGNSGYPILKKPVRPAQLRALLRTQKRLLAEM